MAGHRRKNGLEPTIAGTPILKPLFYRRTRYPLTTEGRAVDAFRRNHDSRFRTPGARASQRIVERGVRQNMLAYKSRHRSTFLCLLTVLLGAGAPPAQEVHFSPKERSDAIDER